MNKREAKRAAYGVAAELLLDNVDQLEAMDPADREGTPADQARLLAGQLELVEQLVAVHLQLDARTRRTRGYREVPGQLALE